MGVLRGGNLQTLICDPDPCSELWKEPIPDQTMILPIYTQLKNNLLFLVDVEHAIMCWRTTLNKDSQ